LARAHDVNSSKYRAAFSGVGMAAPTVLPPLGQPVSDTMICFVPASSLRSLCQQLRVGTAVSIDSPDQ